MEVNPKINGWQFEGTPEAYEAYLVPLLALWTDELIEMAGLNPQARILDVACGTGIVARRAAQRMGNVASITGLDSNDGMLQVAQTLWDGRQPSIDWRKGDVAALPFPNQAFDTVFCQQGLQFFPDRLAALKEIHRVLAPGGRLAISVWRSIQYNRHIAVDAHRAAHQPVNRRRWNGLFAMNFHSHYEPLRQADEYNHVRIAIRWKRIARRELDAQDGERAGRRNRRDLAGKLAGLIGDLTPR
jgi:ubiquinone/menaquinone biosynthesis C-methylase UbiE